MLFLLNDVVFDLDEACPVTPGDARRFERLGFDYVLELGCDMFAEDPLLRPMYPEEDLGPAEDRLRMFLEQYWGGPTTYSEQRGHPRLRMRHAPFPVDTWARETWLRHMRAAMDTLELSPLHDGIMWDYFDRAAHAMVNRPG